MTALGGYTLPNKIDSTSTTIERIHIGNQTDSLDGTTNSQTFDNLNEWTVTVKRLTAAEYALLMAKLDDRDAQAWTPPEGGSYTVVVRGNPRIPYTHDRDLTTPLYDVEFVLREQP